MIQKIPTVLKLIKMLDQHGSFHYTLVRSPLCCKIYISVFHYDLSKPRVSSQSLYCFMIEGGEFRLGQASILPDHEIIVWKEKI